MTFSPGFKSNSYKMRYLIMLYRESISDDTYINDSAPNSDTIERNGKSDVDCIQSDIRRIL